MPIRLLDGADSLSDAGASFKSRARDAWEGFANFALTDNVLEVAVGLV